MPVARFLIGLLLAFGIGAVCRLTGVPLPAPLALVGAALVVAMTSGFLLADRLKASR